MMICLTRRFAIYSILYVHSHHLDHLCFITTQKNHKKIVKIIVTNNFFTKYFKNKTLQGFKLKKYVTKIITI